MISRVISGGQTGADQAGLAAARTIGIPTGGTAPRGFLTETGPDPGLRDYGLVEHASSSYPPRTLANIADADLTVIVASAPLDGGSLLTRDLCMRYRKPWIHVRQDAPGEAVGSIVEAIRCVEAALGRPIVVNVAGNRESKAKGIRVKAEALLGAAFLEAQTRREEVA